MSAADKGNFTAPLPAAGGWPIQSQTRDDGRVVFTRFSSIPSIPIIMKFEAPANVLSSTTSGLRANGAALTPRLVDFLLRRFFGDAVDVDQDLEEVIFLTDRREMTDMRRHDKHYGSKADPLEAMARNGYLLPWFNVMRAVLHNQRSNNSMDIFRACKAIDNHIATALRKHIGDIMSDLHMSDRISQVANWMNNHSNSPFANIKINSFFTKMVNSEKVPEVCRTDYSSRLMFFFLFMISDLNRNMKLNALNLKVFVELLNGALLWFMGERDSTASGFFSGMQIMGGAGHFRVLHDRKEFIYRVKDNSKGGDFIKNLANTLLVELGQYYGTSSEDNLQLFLTLNKWTPESLNKQTAACISNGVVVGLPDRKLKDRSFVSTEMRATTPLGPLITWGLPRDIGPKVSITTQDPQQTNKRVVATTVQVSNVHFCLMCTNTMPESKEQNEETKTLGPVTHCTVPGADAYFPIKQDTDQLNDLRCDQFTGRPQKLPYGERRDTLVKSLGWSHMVSMCYGALFQRSGVIPNEIPDVITSFLDWMIFYYKHWCGSIFGKGVAADISRMVTGYTARHVSLSGWLATVAEVVQDRPVEDIMFRMNKRMMLCCLPSVQVFLFCL